MGNSCFVCIGGVKSHQENTHSPRKKVIGLEFLRFKFHKSLCWLEIQISTHLAPKTVDVQNYFYYTSVICVQNLLTSPLRLQTVDSIYFKLYIQLWKPLWSITKQCLAVAHTHTPDYADMRYSVDVFQTSNENS